MNQKGYSERHSNKLYFSSSMVFNPIDFHGTEAYV